MAYQDEMNLRKAAWAAEERAALQPLANVGQHSRASDADSGTSWVRGMGTAVCILGAFCLIPPATPFGLAMLAFGGLCLAFSPTMARAEDNCYQVTKQQVSEGTGIGLWAFIRGVLIGAFLICLAGAVAIVLGLAMLHGGA